MSVRHNASCIISDLHFLQLLYFSGKLGRGSDVRVVRGKEVIYEGKISGLKQQKGRKQQDILFTSVSDPHQDDADSDPP